MVEFVEYSDIGRIEIWCEEHLRILDALTAGDAELAAERLAAHLQRARNSVEDQTIR